MSLLQQCLLYIGASQVALKSLVWFLFLMSLFFFLVQEFEILNVLHVSEWMNEKGTKKVCEFDGLVNLYEYAFEGQIGIKNRHTPILGGIAHVIPCSARIYSTSCTVRYTVSKLKIISIGNQRLTMGPNRCLQYGM